MAMGIAGKPVSETWIRSRLVLWLIYYMIVNLSAYLTGRDAPTMNKLGASPQLECWNSGIMK
jgi:hypothetical protein